MTLYTNNAEGFSAFSAGTPVTIGNSGGASGTAFNEIRIQANGAVTSSTAHPAHNTWCYYMFANGGTDKCMCRLDFAPTNTASARWYYYWGSLPGVATNLCSFYDSVAFTTMGSFVISGTNKLQMTTKAGTVNGDMGTLSAGTLYRFEMAITKGTGAGDGKFKGAYFLGDGTTAIQQFETTTTNVGTDTVGRLYIGSIGTGVKFDVYLDSIAVDDASYSFLGPGSAIVAPPNLAVPTSYLDDLIVVNSATAGGGGTLAYGAAPAGKIVANLGNGIFVMDRDVSTGADYNATFTVTESPSGQSANRVVLVPKLPDPTPINVMAPRYPTGANPGTGWST